MCWRPGARRASTHWSPSGAGRCASGSSGRARRWSACRPWSSSTTRTVSSSTAPRCAATSPPRSAGTVPSWSSRSTTATPGAASPGTPRTTWRSAGPRSTRPATPATGGSSRTSPSRAFSRGTACAGSPSPVPAPPRTPVNATSGLERAVHSLLEHRTYIEALTDEDPETYVRGFLTQHAEATGERFGGRPAVAFELFGR
ncbi:hypothetical protein SAFG77S_11911 [Streptomyces afghaniensis]